MDIAGIGLHRNILTSRNVSANSNIAFIDFGGNSPIHLEILVKVQASLFVNDRCDITFCFYVFRNMNIPVSSLQCNIPSGSKLSKLSNNKIALRILFIIAIRGSFHSNIPIYG